jgi:hypothetical protein
VLAVFDLFYFSQEQERLEKLRKEQEVFQFCDE